QTVGAVAGFLEKAKKDLQARNIDLEEVVETRLFEDMRPFRFQVICVANHSLGAIRALEKGVYKPSEQPAYDYAGLQTLIAETLEGLRALKPADVNALEGRDMLFQVGDLKIPFTAENYVMSFAMPNLHFHATTAYDILRQKGVPVGKQDYLGQLRIKR
ncbi:MAG: DUF1993 family protein, partial [Hyphomonadaceae bacterium]